MICLISYDELSSLRLTILSPLTILDYSHPTCGSSIDLVNDVICCSTKTVTLPVKLTKPLTSILYISNSKQHLIELRKVVQHVDVPVLGE